MIRPQEHSQKPTGFPQGQKTVGNYGRVRIMDDVYPLEVTALFLRSDPGHWVVRI